MLKKDEEDVYISLKELRDQFGSIQALDLVIEKLLDMHVLRYFKNDSVKVVVDNYELLYKLIQTLELREKEF